MAKITIRIDDIEKELLEDYAEEHDDTISQVIRRLIKEFLDKEYDR
jgi:predicted transcriptional regulator